MMTPNEKRDLRRVYFGQIAAAYITASGSTFAPDAWARASAIADLVEQYEQAEAANPLAGFQLPSAL